MSCKKSITILSAVFLVLVSCSKKNPGNKTFEQADQMISTALDDSLFAGAVLLAGTSDEILHISSFGYAECYGPDLAEVPNPEIMTNDHLFDLASLTKVLGTTYGLMVLHSRGQFEINEPVSKYIPEFDTPEKRTITIEQLLRHKSGLIPWFPSYYVASTPQERLQFIASYPLENPPGEIRRYSDFGFMVLGDLIEKLTQKPLDLFLKEEVYDPLGLSSTVFVPDTTDFNRIVSTSHGNPFEKRMVHDDDFGYTIDIGPELWNKWRTYTLRGEVNDGNAHYTHQGVAGHAGLFSTARDIYTMLAVLLNNGFGNGSRIINPETIQLFLTPDSNGQGLGWLMNENYLHGKGLPEGSFGHTGFTGTSVIVSPETDRVLILLTNRQHFGVNESGGYPDLRPLREELSEEILGYR